MSAPPWLAAQGLTERSVVRRPVTIEHGWPTWARLPLASTSARRRTSVPSSPPTAGAGSRPARAAAGLTSRYAENKVTVRAQRPRECVADEQREPQPCAMRLKPRA